jgi:hypothetical protein
MTAFFLETGVVLLLAPWSQFWDRNFFAQSLPALHSLIINDFVRGAVSGVGIVNILAAVAEMHDFFAERRTGEPVLTLKHSPAAEE